jgi:GT2 family glycosyltransferase
MEATVGLISAHVHAHQAMTTAKVAVTGYSPVVVTKASPPLMQKTANEYEKYFFELGRKDRKPTPLDLCGSNFSVPVSTLNEVNGFDETYFFQRIDFELAVRLIERGYDIRFSRDARADMHLAVTEDDLIDRASARAKNDWRLAVQYPWCAPYLPFFRAVRDPATQLRWQLLWKTADIVAPIFSKLRKVAPRSVRLMSWEYATRYCMALGEAAGNWHSLCSVANRGEAKE